MIRILEIKNFLSIEHLTLELNQLNIFVCKNIQHKEIILKIIFFCELLEFNSKDLKDLTKHYHYKAVFDDLFLAAIQNSDNGEFEIKYSFADKTIKIYFETYPRFELIETNQMSLEFEDDQINPVDFLTTIEKIKENLASIGYDSTIKDIYFVESDYMTQSFNFDIFGAKTQKCMEESISILKSTTIDMGKLNLMPLCYGSSLGNKNRFYLKDFISQFPIHSQRDIIYAILICLIFSNCRWNLTTYSPQAFFIINSAIASYKYEINNPSESNPNLSREMWLNPEKINAYLISSDDAKSIVHQESKLIDYDILHSYTSL